MPETLEIKQIVYNCLQRQWTNQKTDFIVKFLGGINKKKDVEKTVKFSIEGSMELTLSLLELVWYG